MSADPRLADIMTAQAMLAAAIEREITRSARELLQVQDEAARRAAWDRLLWLHRQRTKATVEDMEKQRGLA